MSGGSPLFCISWTIGTSSLFQPGLRAKILPYAIIPSFLCRAAIDPRRLPDKL
jgi:hypothetical protein